MNAPTPSYFSDTPVPSRELQQTGSSLRRLLLQVEDNQANAELLKQMISRRDDLELLTATDGNQGIVMASSHQPDVILMDMKLPGINGFKAFVRLRSNPTTANIPVIALSSNAYKDEINQ